MNPLFFYRLGCILKKYHIPLLPRICEGLTFLVFNSSIPLACTIGEGTTFEHRGIGIVINRDTTIGKDCVIQTHVVMGGGGRIPGAPVIKNNVYIGTGAKIIGGVTVGDNAVIGANAVVISDIPPNALAVGVPAKVKKLGK